jgi:hypothetical protein
LFLVHHIRCLLLGVKAILKKSANLENGGNDTTDFLNMSSISGISSMIDDAQQKSGGADISYFIFLKFLIFKIR